MKEGEKEATDAFEDVTAPKWWKTRKMKSEEGARMQRTDIKRISWKKRQCMPEAKSLRNILHLELQVDLMYGNQRDWSAHKDTTSIEQSMFFGAYTASLEAQLHRTFR